MSATAPARRAGPGRLCLAAALILATTPALAQTAPQGTPDAVPTIDFGPVLEVPETSVVRRDPPPAAPPRPALPEGPMTVPEYERARPSETDPALAASPPADDILLPLRARAPTLDGIQRLSGEVQSTQFFIDLPAGFSDAAVGDALARDGAHDLVLSYRIAINVLPEQSELLVRVNGTDLPAIRPDAFEGFEPVVLPGAQLVDGVNDILVTVRHAHRIFCGPEATFAVWTEIDTAASGVRLARAEMPGDQAGLALALRAQLGGQGAVPVRLIDPADAALLAPLSRRLSALRDGLPVTLAVEPAYGVATGAAQKARITVLPGGVFDALPLAEVRQGADGALVLVLAAGLDGTLPDLDPLLPRPAAPQDIATLRPGTETRLSDLGFTETATFNRYSQQVLAFRMPRDWLILASQQALLTLVYSFADGLPEGALMLVKINDTTVRLLPLDRGGGKVQPPLEIGFPARLLHPGANALRFETIVPGDPPDLPCPTVTAPLMTIEPGSTLLVPPSPKMRVPELDAALTALRPDQIRPVTREGGDPAAEALVTALASALRPIDGTERIEAARLIVTDPSGLDLLGLAELRDPGLAGVTRRGLERLFPLARGGAAPPPAPRPDSRLDSATRAGSVAEDGVMDGWSEGTGLVGRATALLGDVAARLRHLAKPDDGLADRWLAGRTAPAALLMMPDRAQPEALWLIVAPGTDPQRIAVLLAQARMSPDGPRGRLSVLTSEGHWDSWQDTTRPPALEETLTLTNFRTVAGNYASWSPALFGAALLGLTLVSVGLALLFVVTTRGRRKR